jgi:membrane protease YdiL (CAAX protease family)
MSAVRRHPLITFFVLTYALTWWAVPFGGFIPTGPLLAALIVIPLTQGLSGLRELGSRIIRWRVRWHWYALAIGLPLAVHLLTVGLNVGLGAPAPSLAQFSPLSSLILVFAVRLINPLDGPMGEEPGWRGFALPTLQTDRSPLLATLILGVLVTLWHLPLWLLPQFGASPIDILGDILGTLGVTLWYTWLFNHTGGSILMTIVAHATEGTIQTEAFWNGGAAAARMSLLYGAVWLAVAIGLVVFDRQLWRGPAPAPARAQPASYGGERRVR